MSPKLLNKSHFHLTDHSSSPSFISQITHQVPAPPHRQLTKSQLHVIRGQMESGSQTIHQVPTPCDQGADGRWASNYPPGPSSISQTTHQVPALSDQGADGRWVPNYSPSPSSISSGGRWKVGPDPGTKQGLRATPMVAGIKYNSIH